MSHPLARPYAGRDAGLLAGLFAGLLVAASPAAAADLFKTKTQAAYMRACTAQGEGFVYIPGTDTCLKVGGYAWAEGYFNTYTDYPASDDKTYSIATAGAILDARTATDYGTLRSYLELRFKWRTADPWSNGPNGSEIEVWNAYIQFAGFTFGHAQSFFDFYANANVLGTDPGTIGDDVRINLIAYTYEFGQGFSTTLSVEDSHDRNGGVLAQNPTLPVVFDDYQAGARIPDFVANLKYEGDWGSAQISGALHQTNAVTVLNQFVGQSQWGYAVQAGIMFNLPALGEGDTFYLQTAYADGAISYLGLQDPSGSYTPPDAYVGVFGLTKVSGWNVTASLLHNWTDKWSSALFGGYAAYDYNDPTAQFFYGASGGTNYNVGGYLAFAPVDALTIALQYDFTFNEATDFLPTDFGPALASTDASRVLLFVSRDF